MSRESLSSVDAAWLRMEDPTNLMMVTGLLLFEEPLDPARIRRTLEERLLVYPRFKDRVEHRPLGIGPPSWVSDRRFDLDAHLHRVALPAPGDQAALEGIVSDLMSTPLDFTKPLWQVHLIDGYGGGSALLARIHHCIADGIALVQVLLSLTDPTPRVRKAPPAPPRRAPTTWFGVAQNLFEQGVATIADPQRALRLAATGAGAATALARLTLLPPDPATVLKGPLGVTKRAAWSAPIPLTEVKAAGKSVGATINDVLITAAAGALRRYLLSRGERVAGLDLRAAIPVNLRRPDRAHHLGNQFGLVFLSLPIGIADPFRRLSELKRRMDELKGSLDPVVAFGVLHAIGQVPNRVQPLAVEFFGSKASAVMTNVPGPPKPLFLAGRRLSQIMFWVPQSGRMALGLSILSYAGGVMIGVASDAGLIPDPQTLVEGFQHEFAVLKAGRAAASTPSKQRGRPRARTG